MVYLKVPLLCTACGAVLTRWVVFAGVEDSILVGASDSTNANDYSDYEISSTGQRTGSAVASWGSFDARVRPWYILGLQKAGVNFGEVYQVHIDML